MFLYFDNTEMDVIFLVYNVMKEDLLIGMKGNKIIMTRISTRQLPYSF